jgi:hypothetical protein
MELATSLSQMTLASPHASVLPARPFRFMALPAELRIAVYEELVVVGKVFFTPDWLEISETSRFEDYDQLRPPQLQILRVSKTLQKEAEQVYLTK